MAKIPTIQSQKGSILDASRILSYWKSNKMIRYSTLTSLNNRLNKSQQNYIIGLYFECKMFTVEVRVNVKYIGLVKEIS